MAAVDVKVEVVMMAAVDMVMIMMAAIVEEVVMMMALWLTLSLARPIKKQRQL